MAISLFEGSLVASILTLGGAMWRLAFKFGGATTLLEEIATNHLPHMSDEIRELRKAFILHLEGHSK